MCLLRGKVIWVEGYARDKEGNSTSQRMAFGHRKRVNTFKCTDKERGMDKALLRERHLDIGSFGMDFGMDGHYT